MEHPPSNKIERKEGPITKERVIELLKANPEDLSPLHEFLDGREPEVKSSKEALKLTIEVAEIKRDAGRVEGAKEAFADAAEHAWQEQEDELHAYCVAELGKLGGN